MDYKILQEYGIDYQKGLVRCMDDASFYESFITSFVEDDAFERAKQAYEKRNYSELFCCVHELKGVCSNADLPILSESVSAVVELLRHQDGTAAEVDKSFQKLEQDYYHTIEGIRLAQESG